MPSASVVNTDSVKTLFEITCLASSVTLTSTYFQGTALIIIIADYILLLLYYIILYYIILYYIILYYILLSVHYKRFLHFHVNCRMSLHIFTFSQFYFCNISNITLHTADSSFYSNEFDEISNCVQC